MNRPDPARHRRVSEQQPVQVQDQAGVQRTPVLAEQIVLGVAVPGWFLLAAVAHGVVRRSMVRWARSASATMTPSIADDAVMLRTRARSASSVSSPGIWSR
jgi:hypothetical protein